MLEKFPTFATDGLFEKFTRIIEENVLSTSSTSPLDSGHSAGTAGRRETGRWSRS